MKRNRWVWLSAVGLAIWLPACAQKSDVEAVQASQKEILVKLEKIEKDQATILANLQPQRPTRPEVDPNKVYEIPVGNSYVHGPKNAPVTIVEFSDFQ
jgi:protein-disulfide isomerase